MNRIALVMVVALAGSTVAGAADIAFYVGAPNTTGWYDDPTQLQDVETILDETGHLFKDIQQFNDGQFYEFGAWVDKNTNDGEMDILWLNGCMPSVLYPFPNLQPDGSRMELWLDGGNMVINVADWFGYISYEGGWRRTNNLEWGAANILDLPAGVIMYADNTWLQATPTGKKYLPSLPDSVVTYRPVVLTSVQAPWEVAAIFASGGGSDDPLIETLADPVVLHNTETGAYAMFVNQAGGGPATWIDRGKVCAEFIANWVMAGREEEPPDGEEEPPQSRHPQPADGAVVDVDVPVVLSWSPGAGAVQYDVYFGSDPNQVDQADTGTAAIYRGGGKPLPHTPCQMSWRWARDATGASTTSTRPAGYGKDLSGVSPWRATSWWTDSSRMTTPATGFSTSGRTGSVIPERQRVESPRLAATAPGPS